MDEKAVYGRDVAATDRSGADGVLKIECADSAGRRSREVEPVLRADAIPRSKLFVDDFVEAFAKRAFAD